jgi:signal transduction histidine kinase
VGFLVGTKMSERPLLTLPTLARGEERWKLPLCDSSAMAIALALVAVDAAARTAKLAEAMVVDPALLIWTLLHYGSSPSGEIPDALPSGQSIQETASWLSPQLAVILDWRGESLVSFTSQQYGRFAAFVAESVGAAREAFRSSGASGAVAEPLYCAALAAHWKEWLAISQLHQPPAENVSAKPSELSAESRAAADEAWRRWLTEIPGIQEFLPLLAGHTKRLAALETSFDDRLQAAKLDAMKEFAYGAGHELNNPLANIATRAQTLLADEIDPERRRRLAAINTQAFRAHEMLADMMLFARPPQIRLEPVDLVTLIDEAIATLADEGTAQEIVIHPPSRRDALTIEADRVQLRVALLALCRNSLEVLGRGGNLSLELCVGDTDLVQNGPHCETVKIIVSDDGPGIPPEARDKIFDPFFSGREAGRGLGFGLSKCWRIATLHGGRVDCTSEVGHGATFTLTLPLRNDKNQNHASQAAS